MVKRKGKTTNISSLLFEDVDPYGATVGQPAATGVERYPLAIILPDPNQPRQLLPIDLAEALFNGQMTPAMVMQTWQGRTATQPDSPQNEMIQELQRLASSIAQHGLINPITVRPSEIDEAPPSIQYIIVTGERRYWAHVLLSLKNQSIQEGDESRPATEIKASIVPDGSLVRAHQIIENLIREDINVIEKAHGLWALRYELSYDAYRRQLAEEGVSDAYRRHDEYPKEMPLVPWRQVEKTLDMSRQYRARIIGSLSLCEEAQEIVHQHNLAEATIRPIIEKLKTYPDLQVHALRQLVLWQDEEASGIGDGRQIVPSMRAYAERLLKQAKPTEPTAVSFDVTPQPFPIHTFEKRVRGIINLINQDELLAVGEAINSNQKRDKIRADLMVLREQLEELLTAVEAGEEG